MVEWKYMWEVTTWDKKFTGVDKSMQPRVIKYHYYLANELSELENSDGDIRILYTTDKIAFVNSADVEGNISEGEIVAIPWGGNVSIKYYNGKFVTADNRIATSNNKEYLNNKYLFYWMSSRKDEISKFYRGAGIQHPSMFKVLTMLIPIPSLSEQNRIVGILDTFTASIDNLKEQIAQRRKQYEYYRDELLDLEGEEGVEMKNCGEVCEVTDYVANGSFATLRENVTYKQEPDYAVLVRTVDLTRNFEGDKIYIDEKAYHFLSKSSLFGGEIIINNIGAGVGQTFRCPYLKEKMSLGPNSILVRTPNNDFFYYWFNSIYGQNAMMKVVTPGAMPKFNKSGFKTLLIPLPSLSEQQRIVSILDTFEASIQNLEAQLSQREKQYEFYRNILLSFE